MLLHPYFDGELDPDLAAQVRTHLDGCATCAREIAALDELRGRVRGEAPRFQAPEELRRSIAALGSGATRSAPAERVFGRRQWLALAAAAAGAAVVSSFATRWALETDGEAGDRMQLVHDLLASHLRADVAASPVDIASTDQHNVKPWFAGRVGVSPPVADYATEGFALVGGRIDYVGGERVPVLVYRHRRHRIDVYFLSDSAKVSAPAGNAYTLQGYHFLHTRLGGLSAWIVSDMDARELARFTALLARAS